MYFSGGHEREGPAGRSGGSAQSPRLSDPPGYRWSDFGEGPRCVHELQTWLESIGTDRKPATPLAAPQGVADSGLVTTTRRGAEITYQLADDHVGDIVDDAIRHSQEEHP